MRMLTCLWPLCAGALPMNGDVGIAYSTSHRVRAALVKKQRHGHDDRCMKPVLHSWCKALRSHATSLHARIHAACGLPCAVRSCAVEAVVARVHMCP